MLKIKRPHQEATHDWQHIRPFLKDPAQITYEIRGEFVRMACHHSL